MKKAILFATALAATAAFPVGSLAVDDAAVKVGILACEAVEGTRVNLLIRSTVDVVCTFEGESGTKYAYKGETGITLGLDLSFRKNEKFAFSVLSSSPESTAKDALAGKYVGASVSASIGVGLGAAALIGGSAKNFGLQPLALESNEGFGISGGIGFLYIEAQ